MEYLHTDYKLQARAAGSGKGLSSVTSKCESLLLTWRLKCWHLQDTGVRMCVEQCKVIFEVHNVLQTCIFSMKLAFKQRALIIWSHLELEPGGLEKFLTLDK